MNTKAATTIFTTTLCAMFMGAVMAPMSMADDLPAGAASASGSPANEFQLIVPDVTNCSVPDTAPYASLTPPAPAVTPEAGNNAAAPGFDLSASRSYNMQSQAPPSNDLLPAQTSDSASTPNVSTQMPLVQQAPQAAAADPAQAFAQTSPAEQQTAQEWRRAAFESLTSNPNVQPMFGRTQAQMQNANASANAGTANGANADNAPANNAVAGNANPGQMGAPAANYPTNVGMNPSIAQSQTLTGASSNQQYGQATKRGNGSPGGGTASSGVSSLARYASMFTMMGGGLMMGSMMRR